jgi:hypothetical protein
MEIKMTKVESSCIESVGFVEESNELYVKFNSGRTYMYPNCSKTLYENFMNSSSKGRFLNDYFVGTNCQRIS